MLKKNDRTSNVAVILISLFLVYNSPSANAESSTILGTTGAYPNAITIDSSGNIYTASEESGYVWKVTVFDQAAANAEAARVATATEAAKKAKEQKELTELLSVIPSIAGLALNLGELTNSLLTTKCVKGKTVKYVKKGAKCPKGFVKKN
jgi:hypothetical protein